MRRLHLLVVLLLALGPAGCDGGAPGGTGTADVLWTAPKADPYDNTVQPALDGRHAFVATDGKLTAYDLETGARAWSRRVLAEGRSYGARRVVIDPGGPVYVRSVDAFWAFDPADGRPLWSRVVEDFSAVGLSKTADDAEALYLPGRGAVQAVRKADGALGVRYPLGALAPSGADEIANDLAVADGVLYVPVAWSVDGDSVGIRGGVYAFDAATGRRLWTYEVPSYKKKIEGRRDSSWAEVGVGGVAPGGDLLAAATGSSVLALSRATGEAVWERRLPDRAGFWVGPTVAGGAVYAAGVTRWVHKLDLATGETVWDRQVEGSLTPIITVDRGQVLFVDDAWGELWVLDDASGDVVWRAHPPGRRESGALYLSPVAVGDRRLVVVGDQAVYGLTRP